MELVLAEKLSNGDLGGFYLRTDIPSTLCFIELEYQTSSDDMSSQVPKNGWPATFK